MLIYVFAHPLTFWQPKTEAQANSYFSEKLCKKHVLLGITELKFGGLIFPISIHFFRYLILHSDIKESYRYTYILLNTNRLKMYVLFQMAW